MSELPELLRLQKSESQKASCVQIHLGVEDEDKVRVPRCLEIFENYCTVTPSVRKGIEVNVNYVLSKA